MHKSITVTVALLTLLLGISISLDAGTGSPTKKRRHVHRAASADTAAAPQKTAARALPIDSTESDSAASETDSGQSSVPDSAASAILEALQRDDSLKNLPPPVPAEPVEQTAIPITAPRANPVAHVIAWATNHLPLAASGAALLLVLATVLLLRTRARGKAEALRFMTTTRLSLMNTEVQRACLYIEKHYKDPALTPESLCRAIITGEPFLEALFQKELGMSIRAYINQTRIHRARLLASKDPDIEPDELAAACGFAGADEFAALWLEVNGSGFESYLHEKQTALHQVPGGRE